MLPGISSQSEIKQVFSRGKSFKLSFGNLFVFKKEGLNEPASRLVVVAKRKLGKAVQRNRARRIVKEAFRKALKDIKADMAFDAVLILYKAEIDFNSVLDEISDKLKCLFEENEKNNR